MPIEITAAVRGHLREASKYALIENPDAPADILIAHLLVEMGDHVTSLCRERDARQAEASHQKGRAP